MKGGGGNSMFANCWSKPSHCFVKKISAEAKKRLKDNRFFPIDDAPSSFKHNNAKGAKNRKTKGKQLHLDHNPGNVKVLQLIREKCKTFDLDKQNYEDIIKDLKEYLKNIQTLDWITVE